MSTLMLLEFAPRTVYGRTLYYPHNRAARAIVDLTGRKCLKRTELEHLEREGFTVTLLHGELTEELKHG